jgi:hypothetical protein
MRQLVCSRVSLGPNGVPRVENDPRAISIHSSVEAVEVAQWLEHQPDTFAVDHVEYIDPTD